MPRTIRERLQFEMNRMRRELLTEIEGIGLDGLDFKPEPSMKSYAKIIYEIGWMEAETAAMILRGEIQDENVSMARIRQAPPSALLEDLAEVRAELMAWLDQASEEELESTVSLPDGWEKFYGTTQIERSELFRWLARHEYYHIGQIISYRWIQGHNPYE